MLVSNCLFMHITIITVSRSTEIKEKYITACKINFTTSNLPIITINLESKAPLLDVCESEIEIDR